MASKSVGSSASQRRGRPLLVRHKNLVAARDHSDHADAYAELELIDGCNTARRR
jgi:hypothetical protein